jgi:hypothetical protein
LTSSNGRPVECFAFLRELSSVGCKGDAGSLQPYTALGSCFREPSLTAKGHVPKRMTRSPPHSDVTPLVMLPRLLTARILGTLSRLPSSPSPQSRLAQISKTFKSASPALSDDMGRSEATKSFSFNHTMTRIRVGSERSNRRPLRPPRVGSEGFAPILHGHHGHGAHRPVRYTRRFLSASEQVSDMTAAISRCTSSPLTIPMARTRPKTRRRTSSAARVSWSCAWSFPSWLCLIFSSTHNHGTESDENFKGYASGNEEPGKGFGHIAFSVDDVQKVSFTKLLHANVYRSGGLRSLRGARCQVQEAPSGRQDEAHCLLSGPGWLVSLDPPHLGQTVTSRSWIEIVPARGM